MTYPVSVLAPESRDNSERSQHIMAFGRPTPIDPVHVATMRRAGAQDTGTTRSLLMDTYNRHESVQRFETKKVHNPATNKTVVVYTSCSCDLCKAIRVRYNIADPGQTLVNQGVAA